MYGPRFGKLRPLAAAIALAWTGAAPAATLTVDGTTCDLSNAIIAANTDSAQGGCPAGSGADTLNLTAPIFTAATPAGTSPWGPLLAYPLISSIITIQGDPDGDGQGSIIERSNAPATPEFQLFLIYGAGGHLTLDHVTLRNASGKGIYNVDGTLSLIHSTITATGAGPDAGGIGITSMRGEVNLSHSTLSANNTGLICRYAGCAIRNSRISDNQYSGVDAGDYASVSVTDSTIAGNGTGVSGGGIDAHLNLSHVIVSNNRGAGIINLASLSLQNTTVSGNRGTGVYSASFSTLTAMSNSTITRNGGGGLRGPAPSAFVSHSILAGNRGGDCSVDPTSFPGSLAGNLIGDGSCDAAAHGALTGDAKLALLKDNGGSTFTHALLPGSPAIDAVPGSACEAKDQRGATRPQNAACDIGAFESIPAPTPALQPIVTFFDEAVAAETLIGTLIEPGKTHRLQAVRHQLLLAGDFQAQGDKPATCRQTYGTLIRIDTDGSTPDKNDYVTGPAAPELDARLRALRTEFGCR